MRILVAEDEAVQARVLRAALQKRGHCVILASDGEEAWKLIEQEHFPLVISDWLMPRMSGLDLCRRLRLGAVFPYTYVILLTAKATRDDRLEGLRAGADDFLPKPVDMSELTARLEIAARILTMQQALHDQSRETARLNERLQHQNDALTSLNAELEQFAYVACHDLQEPLRKIQIFGGRLKTGYGEVLDERGRDYLARIENAASRLQDLVKSLFQLSQIDKDPRPLVHVDLMQTLAEVRQDLEARLDQTGGHIEAETLPTVIGDPLQIRQLLLNLIGNGLKYHRTDTPPVVRVTASVLDGSACQIAIQDNGIGFEEEYLDRIFQPFQRLHGVTEYEGTGIGLAICRKIVDRHGGGLTAKSMLGQGATFLVTLPVNNPA